MMLHPSFLAIEESQRTGSDPICVSKSTTATVTIRLEVFLVPFLRVGQGRKLVCKVREDIVQTDSASQKCFDLFSH